MRVTRLENHISLRPDNDEDKAMLKEMGDTGIVVFGRGSYLSFYSKKHSESLNLVKIEPEERILPPEEDWYVIDGELTNVRREWELAVLDTLHDLHLKSIKLRGKREGEVFDFMWSTEKRLENAISIIKEYHKKENQS